MIPSTIPTERTACDFRNTATSDRTRILAQVAHLRRPTAKFARLLALMFEHRRRNLGRPAIVGSVERDGPDGIGARALLGLFLKPFALVA